jgi:hypothetical protein
LKRFAALKNVNAEMDINSVWETIRETIESSAEESLGYYELKKLKRKQILLRLPHTKPKENNKKPTKS